MFYSDGSIKIERHTLRKYPFPDIKLRKILGHWEQLAYKSPHTGDERWVNIEKEFTEEQILEHIRLYGVD
jgi:hypothetical protein